MEKIFTCVALKILQQVYEEVAIGLWSSEDFVKKHVHARI